MGLHLIQLTDCEYNADSWQTFNGTGNKLIMTFRDDFFDRFVYRTLIPVQTIISTDLITYKHGPTGKPPYRRSVHRWLLYTSFAQSVPLVVYFSSAISVTLTNAQIHFNISCSSYEKLTLFLSFGSVCWRNATVFFN